MEQRLKTGIWVAAYLRGCAVAGLPGVVVRKGDETAGSVIVKINLLDGRARAFFAAYNESGDRIWQPALSAEPVDEPEIDAYVERACARDPDLWVIEVEDKSGESHLEGL